MITSIDQLDFSKQYSYADYLTWQFNERVELIKGWIYKMSPGPSRRHQLVVGDIHTSFNMFLKKGTCQVYVAPFDVRLMDSKKSKVNKTIYTVVQPDICIVCDASKLDDKGCIGSPDLIVEVISLGNTKRDIQQKFELYQENKVSEYWIVFPLDEIIQVFDLQNGKYQLRKNYTREDIITANCLPNFELNLSEVFYH